MLKVTSNNPDGGDINQTIVEVGTGKTFTRSFNKNGSTITPLSDWVRLDNFGCNTLSSLASALGGQNRIIRVRKEGGFFDLCDVYIEGTTAYFQKEDGAVFHIDGIVVD